MTPRRLYRSADDRILAGVAGGLAAYFDVDPVIVRIIWFLSIFFTGSLTFWVYLIMIVVVPPEPVDWASPGPWSGGGSPFGFQAAYTPPPSDPAGAPTSPSGTGDPTTSGSVPGSAPAFGAGATPGATPGTGVPPTPTPPPGWGGWSGWGGDDWRWQRRQERWQRRAERWQQRHADGHYHDRGGPGLVFGLILIVGGGLLAWHQIDPSFDLGIIWPVLVIAVGAILVGSSIRSKD